MMMFFFAEENYDAFCLAYMFTYRDFEGGTLGLAWTGDMKNAGGVCERNGVSQKFLCFFPFFPILYGGIKSYNLVSFLSNGIDKDNIESK